MYTVYWHVLSFDIYISGCSLLHIYTKKRKEEHKVKTEVKKGYPRKTNADNTLFSPKERKGKGRERQRKSKQGKSKQG
jgi:hypothetical protein